MIVNLDSGNQWVGGRHGLMDIGSIEIESHGDNRFGICGITRAKQIIPVNSGFGGLTRNDLLALKHGIDLALQEPVTPDGFIDSPEHQAYVPADDPLKALDLVVRIPLTELLDWKMGKGYVVWHVVDSAADDLLERHPAFHDQIDELGDYSIRIDGSDLIVQPHLYEKPIGVKFSTEGKGSSDEEANNG